MSTPTVASHDQESSGLSRARIFAWTLFDFANTAYSVIIVTVIFSTYFITLVAEGQNRLWGLAVSLSMVLAAMVAPPLGAAADYSKNKKLFLLLFTVVSIVCTGLMFYVHTGMVLFGMVLFILANIGFEGGIVFYDAFLPSITSRRSYGRVSGYGFAMGYLGALAVLLIVKVILPDASSPDYVFFLRLSFATAAAFFLVFSLPMFLWVPEPLSSEAKSKAIIRTGFQQAGHTLRILFVERKHPSVARFLVAFFIYNDAILTIIAFSASFALQVLHMSMSEVIVFFTVVQTSAVLGSFLFGFLTDKIGPKKTISITLVLWVIITGGAYFVTTVATFYIVALGAGAALGSCQSASRSLMALLTPKEREAEFFGFYDGLCGKASAVVGPFLYGIIADLTNQRVAVLFIGLIFLVGLVLLQKVSEPDRRSSVSPSAL